MTREQRRVAGMRWFWTVASLALTLWLGVARAQSAGALPDDDMSLLHRMLVLGGAGAACALALLGLGLGIFQLRKELRRRRRGHYRGYPGRPKDKSPH